VGLVAAAADAAALGGIGVVADAILVPINLGILGAKLCVRVPMPKA